MYGVRADKVKPNDPIEVYILVLPLHGQIVQNII